MSYWWWHPSSLKNVLVSILYQCIQHLICSSRKSLRSSETPLCPLTQGIYMYDPFIMCTRQQMACAILCWVIKCWVFLYFVLKSCSLGLPSGFKDNGSLEKFRQFRKPSSHHWFLRCVIGRCFVLCCKTVTRNVLRKHFGEQKQFFTACLQSNILNGSSL